MNTREDLQRWDDFIAAQMLAFDAAYLVKAGEPHVADPLRIAFLQVSDSLCQANVERAIDDFPVNDACPIWLSLDELVNLTHRADFARYMLQLMLGLQRGAPAVFVAAASKVPCATDPAGVPALAARGYLAHPRPGVARQHGEKLLRR